MRRVAPNRAALEYVAELRAGRGAPPPYAAPAGTTTARVPTCPPASSSTVVPVPAGAPAVLAAAHVNIPSGLLRRRLLLAAAAALVAFIVGACALAVAQDPGAEPTPAPPTAVRIPAHGPGARTKVDARPRRRRLEHGARAPHAEIVVAASTGLVTASSPSGAESWCVAPVRAHSVLPPMCVAHDLAAALPTHALSIARARPSSSVEQGLGGLLLILSLSLFAVVVRGRRVRPKPRVRQEPTKSVRVRPAGARRIPLVLGAVSRKGPVRARCEDRSCALSVRDSQALVVADGMGGHPDGEAAAEIAVEAARRFLAVELRRRGSGASHSSLVRLAITAAARALEDAAAAYGYEREDKALSTTLLILLANGTEYTAGYVGDGGMVVARADGETTAIMEPQKGEAVNIVLGSLGPSGIEGRPVVKALARRPGDLVVIGTDGVFDRVPSDFAARLRALVLERGDVTSSLAAALDQLERVTDEQGPVADDNLTLAAILTEA